MLLFCSRVGYFQHALTIIKRQHYVHFNNTKLQLKNICIKPAASPLPRGCSVGRHSRNNKFSGRNCTTRWRTLWLYYTMKEHKAERQSTKIVNRAHLVMSKPWWVFFHIHQLCIADRFFATGLSATATNQQVLLLVALIQLPWALALTYFTCTETIHFLLLRLKHHHHVQLDKSLPVTVLC